MNREIKFRAWDIVHNKMIYLEDCVSFGYIDEFDVYELYFEENVLRCRGYKGDDYDFGVGITDETDLPIMQYTGLKDKNGVEIYEGDKVKAKFYDKEVVGEIGFSDGCFLLLNSCVSDNQLFIFTDIEVIGNIYENKAEEVKQC